MIAVSTLVQAIAEATGEPISAVRMIARRLIDDGVLPKSAGRRIALVSVQHAASLLLAVLAAPAAKDATRTVVTYGALFLNGRRGGGTAAERIGDMLHAVESGSPVTPGFSGNVCHWRIEVCTSWREIFICDGGDAQHRFVEEGKSVAFWQSDQLKRSVTVPGIALAKIAMAMRGAA